MSGSLRAAAGVAIAVAFAFGPLTAHAQTVRGSLSVKEAGFDGFRFNESYVLVIETDTFFPVSPSGAAEVRVQEPGQYTIQSYVPGFEPALTSIRVPGDSTFELRIGLQAVRLGEVDVSKEVPQSVYRANRETRGRILSDEFAPDDRAHDRSLVTDPHDQREGRVDLIGIVRFIYDLITGHDED